MSYAEASVKVRDYYVGLLITNYVLAQTTLTGKITNERGAGLEGVSVRISENKKGTVTDRASTFVLASVLPETAPCD